MNIAIIAITDKIALTVGIPKEVLEAAIKSMHLMKGPYTINGISFEKKEVK